MVLRSKPHRLAARYVLLNPLRVLVTEEVPSSCAETLKQAFFRLGKTAGRRGSAGNAGWLSLSTPRLATLAAREARRSPSDAHV
jgi:hypothetical protein